MADVINQAEIYHDQANTTADDCMYADTLAGSSNTFRTAITTGADCGYINMSPAFTTDQIAGKEAAENEKMVSFEKGGRQCELLQQIAAADKQLDGYPQLDRKIDKQTIELAAAEKERATLASQIRKTAENSLSKQDWADLSGLGKLPFGLAANGKMPEIPINLNNAQRAWLKENHPQLYKMVENHDQASLTESRASQRLTALEQIRDQPVAARLDLVNYHQKMGNNQAAIETLTEIAGMTRSASIEKSFRSAAVSTEAAWDPAFRKAIESSGGNILDYVERPRPTIFFKKHIDKELIREARPAAEAQLRH